jgi:hypothetical protein
MVLRVGEVAPTVADIAVITDDRTHPLLDVEPPAGKRGVELMPDLWLEQLPIAEGEACIDACQERGLNFKGGTRQFSQMYSSPVETRLRAPSSRSIPTRWSRRRCSCRA